MGGSYDLELPDGRHAAIRINQPATNRPGAMKMLALVYPARKGGIAHADMELARERLARDAQTGGDQLFLAERIKALRLMKGLSQRDLAAPGVSYAYISRIEAGTRHPSTKALRRLADKLGVSPNYLEFGNEVDPGLRSAGRKLAALEERIDILERDLERERQVSAGLRAALRRELLAGAAA